MIAERRRQSAGSRLHMRLVRFFTAIALIPTILVAVFAGDVKRNDVGPRNVVGTASLSIARTSSAEKPVPVTVTTVPPARAPNSGA